VSVEALLDRLYFSGVFIDPEGDDLIVEGPENALTPFVLAEISERKSAIRSFLLAEIADRWPTIAPVRTEIPTAAEKTRPIPWSELSTWRWGPAVNDQTPGIVVEGLHHHPAARLLNSSLDVELTA
jgi:hypothetical protein